MGAFYSLQGKLDPNHKYHHTHVDPLAVRLMLPVYYNGSKMTKEDHTMAKNSWDIIATNSSPVYLQNLEVLTKKEFPFESSTAWFYSTFFNRLFDVHPLSRYMFPDSASHNRFFKSLIEFLFSVTNDTRSFTTKLKLLALSHCRKGVKAVEYGIVGEVLFWSFRRCLGDLYDSATHLAWVRLFSSILAVLIPVVVSYELDNNSAQESRMADVSREHAYTFHISVPVGAYSTRRTDYDLDLLGPSVPQGDKSSNATISSVDLGTASTEQGVC